MLNSAVTAGFGFIFWMVVARLYSTEDVGLGSALVSAATLLAFVGSLGLDYGVIRFLSDAKERRLTLINSSLTLAAIATTLICGIFLAGVPLWSPAFLVVRHNPLFVVAFIGFTVAWTCSSIAASVFVGFRRAEFALAERGVYSLSKVALAAALVPFFGVFGIFASWGLATVAALGLSIFLFIPRLFSDYRPRVMLHRQATNDMLHFSFANYISSGLWSLPQWILPIMVVNMLGTTDNAHLFVALGVAGLVFAIPGATSTSLFAEGSCQIQKLAQDFRRSLKLTVLLLLPAIVIVAVAGGKILLLFGRDYSGESGHLLWLLAPSALPMTVNFLYLGVARVLNRLKDIILVAAGIAIGTLVLSYFLMSPLGIWGVAIAWLAAQSLVALALLPAFGKIMAGKFQTGA